MKTTAIDVQMLYKHLVVLAVSFPDDPPFQFAAGRLVGHRVVAKSDKFVQGFPMD
jgi:hypothetical protein